MSSEWRECKFGDLCDISRGASPRPIKDFIAETGMPWVKIADATASESKFITTTKERIKPEGVPKSVSVFPGDLILSNSATPGLPRFMNIKACIHDGWMLLRNFHGLDKDFAYWLLLFERNNLVAQGNGSVFTNLKTDILRNHHVRIPSIEQQQEIAARLNSISDKAQINHQINQTLEQIAQVLFKSWFVDFEPVKAKIAALESGGSEKDALLAAMQAISGTSLFDAGTSTASAAEQLDRLQAEQPKQYNALRATAELFPSAMQDSELGEIPEGWALSIVSNEFDVTMGQSPPGDTYNEASQGTPFFQGRRDFGERFPSNRVYCTEPKRMAKKDDTLLSVRAPVGDTNIASTDCCIGRGIAALRHKSGCSSFTYYSVIQLGHELSSYDSEGTIFGSINQKNLKGISLLAPPRNVLAAFQKTVGDIDNLIKVDSEEAIALATMRDILLPKLLSGELSAPEAKKHAEACT
jgi:type I restriction enzyme S subunit